LSLRYFSTTNRACLTVASLGKHQIRLSFSLLPSPASIPPRNPSIHTVQARSADELEWSEQRSYSLTPKIILGGPWMNRDKKSNEGDHHPSHLVLCSATIAARTASRGDVTGPWCSTAKNRRLSLSSIGDDQRLLDAVGRLRRFARADRLPFVGAFSATKSGRSAA
jgi:hypothetical protein